MTNANAGFVLSPLPRTTITTDIYQIDLRDRIVCADGVNGDAALTAVALTGATLPAGIDLSAVSAYCFANGANIRTWGLDIYATYLTDFRR